MSKRANTNACSSGVFFGHKKTSTRKARFFSFGGAGGT